MWKGVDKMKKILKAIRVYEDDHVLMMELSKKMNNWLIGYGCGGFANAYHRAAVLLKKDIDKMEKLKGE